MMQRLRMHGAVRQPMVNSTLDVFMLNGKMINIPIALGSEEWCKILEQMLLLILIIGRWLLPKGEITREQLSQLLLVYIGMAADIIELFEAFKEQTVRENVLLTIVILSLWTASLIQFTLVVTATKSKKSRASVAHHDEVEGCCPVEVISIFISVSLQDAPFLVLRMLLIFRYDVLSYTNIFFTCKNSLVLVLQFD
ncbi:transmembrane protein 26-like [Physella acuta]|uniref:transmembrane protein 26-like n=1 Tax=Physella acuta TaxID=109671 RepID=UPI0027DE3432|nr:transmembrane protein 26-like [Physella acuta]